MFLSLSLSLIGLLSSSVYCQDDESILNFQFLGTHNSYHKRLESNAMPLNVYDFSDYSLTYQLNHGVRYLELDVHSCDDDGNAGTYRDVLTSVCTDWFISHILEFDSESTCDTLRDCISQIAEWSYQHRGYHLPLFIKIELKHVDLDGKWDNYQDIVELSNVIDDLFGDLYDSDSSSSSSSDSDSDDDGDISCNPILSFNNDYLVNFGGSWANTQLSQMRGTLLFSFTNGVSSYVLDNFINDDTSVTNGWPDDISEVFFGSCKKSHAALNFENDLDWCCIAGNNGAGGIASVSSYNKYIIMANVDTKFVQIKDYSFEVDSVTGEPISVTIAGSSSGSIAYDTWEAQSLYDNIDLGKRLLIGDNSADDTCLTISKEAETDGFLYDCEFYEFLLYTKGVDTANVALASLPTLRGAIGVSDDYLSNAVQLGIILSIVNIDFTSGFIYDKDTMVVKAEELINSGANILATDYPFGTENVENEYQFSLRLTCDNSDDFDVNAPARLKNECLNFLDSSDSDSDSDSDESHCTFGEMIDQFVV